MTAAAASIQVELWPIGRLAPYARNARTHSPEQIRLIARSMEEFGFVNPVLVDAGGTIVAGHGRILAAKGLGLAHVPVIRLGHLTDEQVRAYRIADNQIPLNAGWDQELLRIELLDIKGANGLDLSLLGFDLPALDEIMLAGLAAPADAAADDRDLTDQEQGLLDEAWRRLIDDWRRIVAGELRPISTNYTAGALAVYFVRARMFGSDVPRISTLVYNPHRMSVPGDRDAVGAIFDRAARSAPIARSIQWSCSGRPSFDAFLVKAAAVQGHRMPQDFPATLARDLMDQHLTKANGRVLDPCHGWGGRAIGFLLSEKAGSYTGFDVDERTQAGVRRMIDDLLPFASGKKAATLKLQPFEDAKLKPASFEFALTSPPYFDTEKYEGELSSWRRYRTFKAWSEGFFRPLIASTARALRPGAVFALQVGSQRYPLARAAIEYAAAAGMVHEATIETDIHDQRFDFDAEKHEVILILRRSEK